MSLEKINKDIIKYLKSKDNFFIESLSVKIDFECYEYNKEIITDYYLTIEASDNDYSSNIKTTKMLYDLKSFKFEFIDEDVENIKNNFL